MTDFRTIRTQGSTPTHIHTLWQRCVPGRCAVNLAAPAATTWVNGLGIYMPMALPFPYIVRRLFWVNGSTITSTSADMAVYTHDGTLVCSATPTAMSGASAVQYVTLGTPMLLMPDSYYLAWTCNNTTSRGFASALAAADGEIMGVQQQSSVATLPATMTPVAYAGQGYPFCGITRTGSGY